MRLPPPASARCLRRRQRLPGLALVAALIWPGPMAGLQAAPRWIEVRQGDTLEQLAITYGVDLEALQRLNGIADPSLLQIGQRLQLPEPLRRPAASGAAAPVAPKAPTGGLEPPTPDRADQQASAALLLSPGERRDRAELELREQSGQARWKWFGATAVDWAGWRLHPGGVRITLVKPAAADVGLRTSAATAVGVQCSSLRQTWRIDGRWQPWQSPTRGTVAQRIVLDLCSNTLDNPAVPLPPLPDGP